jgi:gluconokinase
VVLACSALKRAYRDVLREGGPGLRFVFLEIGREDARARVAARASTHYFSPTLVDSQFAALETPVGEPGVLRLDARAPLAQLRDEACAWLRAGESS